MGASQSTSSSTSSGGASSTTTAIQVPIEESLLPPGQIQYSLRDTIDPSNESQSNANNTGTSSVLKSRYGYRINTTAISGETTTGSPLPATPMNTNASSTQFYHSTSGRMMKTFPLRRRTNKNSVPGTTAGNLNAINSPTTNIISESTAVVKVTWLLEQQIDQQQQQPSYRTTSWLDEQVMELQRIRKLTKHMPNVAPYMTWGYVNVLEGNNRGLLLAPKQVLQNVMMLPQNQRYYLPTSSSSLSTTTATTFVQPGPPIHMRAIYMLRSSVYTTLADRISCRPFLSNCEKLWITYQLLQVVQQIHSVNVIHGFLTTENIGLTSTGYVVLLDLSSYKARTMLPDDDPSEYVYYFQPNQSTTTMDNTNSTASTSTTSSTATGSNSNSRNHNYEKRCYLAPERFYSPKSNTTTVDRSSTNNASRKSEPPLTPTMDIFSLGCVITELFLNGERCFDLGDIMEYRKMNAHCSDTDATTTDVQLPNSIQQKLNKIESSAVRAACKHMIHIDPKQRLSAQEYYERLYASDKLPKPFQLYTKITEQMITGNILNCPVPLTTSGYIVATPNYESSIEVAPSASTTTLCTLTPDARIALLAIEYRNILWEAMGFRDTVNESYLKLLIGPTLQKLLSGRNVEQSEHSSMVNIDHDEKKLEDHDFSAIGSTEYTRKLFANVEALLQDLDSSLTQISSGDVNGADHRSNTIDVQNVVQSVIPAPPVENRSDLCKSSLLIYVQIILSTIRHNVQRPSTKLIALQLIQRLMVYVTDDVRLQRTVPVLISLLHDPDPLVRAVAVHALSSTLSIISSFPPSDSKIFPQYIFKRVAHMISDPSIIVRVTFARCIATLAETAQRFLDITHTVRLYELVENGANPVSGATSRDEATPQQRAIGNVDNDSDPKDTIFGDEVTKLLDIGSRVSSSNRLVMEDMEDVAKNDTTTFDLSASNALISNAYSSELGMLQETISRWVVHFATDQSEHCSFPKRAIVSDLNRLCAFFGMEGVMSFILPQILAFLNERKDWQLRALLFEHLPFVCQCIGRAATEEYVLPCIEIGLVDSEERVISCALMCLSRMANTGLLSRSVLLGGTGNEGKESKRKPSFIKKYGPLLLFPSEDIRHYAAEAIISICLMIGSPDCEVYVFPTLRPYLRSSLDYQQLRSVDEFKANLKPAWSRTKVAGKLEDIKNAEKDRSWTSIGVTVSDGTARALSLKNSQTTNEHLSYDSDEFYMLEYLKTLSRHLTQTSIQDRSLSTKISTSLINGIEGSIKLAQNVMFPTNVGASSNWVLPEWYDALRTSVSNLRPTLSEDVFVRSISALREVYGLSIMGLEGVESSNSDVAAECSSNETRPVELVSSPESVNIDAAFRGQWGSETTVDSESLDTTLLLTKLKALDVPPLSLNFGNAAVSRLSRGLSSKDVAISIDWKPRPKSLVATSSTITGHSAPVSRLAVSADHRILVSASHDSTCRVWECHQIDECGGQLENSVVYNDHGRNGPVRVNDVAMVEGTHAVVSGASDGSVHVWRVEMAKAGATAMQTNDPKNQVRYRSVGAANVRKVDKHEGEVLSVSHYNSPSASVITYATQIGMIHSWDLRCECEPFKLHYSPELGYLTSMALGSDRNWIVSGTSTGHVALWDIRFQQCVKLWQHKNNVPISRLATSTVPLPENWTMNISNSNVRSLIFVAAGTNECSMFDVLSSSCLQCFRTVAEDSRTLNSHMGEPPELIDTAFKTIRGSGMVKTAVVMNNTVPTFPISTINCMVGSIGANASSYLITGGSDSSIRYWDFTAPSKCFIVNGMNHINSKPTYERIDFDGERRLMLCRQSQHHLFRDYNKHPRRQFHGLKRPEQNHTDAILDIKVVDNNEIISCSRDCTIKVWR